MDDRIGNLSEMGFVDSGGALSGLDGQATGRLLTAAADVVLIVDKDDVIQDASFSNHELFAGGGRGWRGRALFEIVTSESEPKLKDLLESARNGRTGQPRQVNHPLPEADDLPVNYQATSLNDEGGVILFGRSAGQLASMQRRLMSSQLAMEREMAKLRSSENRYRALFQLSRAAQIMVDAASLRILDINDAAVSLLGKSTQKLQNKRVLSLFDDKDSSVLHKLLLASVDNQGNGSAKVRLASGDLLNLRIVTFKQDGDAHLLIYFLPVESGSSALPNTTETKVLNLVESMPDAFVATDAELNLITANRAFFDLLNISNVSEVEGAELDRFFERPSVDCKVLISNVQEHGAVRRFASTMKSRYGQAVNVEIAACQLSMNDENVMGFWIRPTNNIMLGTEVEQEGISRYNEQIANLVGHMSLKDIVRETTDMIERLCIETALELTKNNRASAAQMLGVSRQSLYTKLGGSKNDKS